MLEIHELKTDHVVFQATYVGVKNFEIRKNDRDFKVNDYLLLRETKFTGEEMSKGNPLIYTGRSCLVKVKCVLEGPIYGLMEGWCILGVDIRDRSN